MTEIIHFLLEVVSFFLIVGKHPLEVVDPHLLARLTLPDGVLILHIVLFFEGGGLLHHYIYKMFNRIK